MQSQSNQQPSWIQNADPFFKDLYRWCGQSFGLYIAAIIGLGAAAFLAFFAFMVVVFNLGAILGLGTGGYVLAYAICALVVGLLAITIGVVVGKLLRRLDQRHGARNPRH